ncbi:hypothetical protein [Priestia megaterium]|uniref:Uncharacterized protein n=1 Tax=Priestia megaterium TaxID=1404 RepID=A0A6M6E770_PRIMG|nr:hypothetical protein [Priestia megaterium]QJX80989.1 hypothetical protein FDZ14_33405 [Priestia megaterium]
MKIILDERIKKLMEQDENRWLSKANDLVEKVRLKAGLQYKYLSETLRFEQYFVNNAIDRKTVSVEKAVEMYFKEIPFNVNYHFLDQELLEDYEYLKMVGLDITIIYEYDKGIKLTYAMIPPSTNGDGLFETLESGLKRFKTDSLELQMIFEGSASQLFLRWMIQYYKAVFKENVEFEALLKERAKHITKCIDEIAT